MAIDLIIVVDDASRHIPAPNADSTSHRWFDHPPVLWDRDTLADALVRSVVVVVLDILRQHSLQVSLADNKQVIQAFFPVVCK